MRFEFFLILLLCTNLSYALANNSSKLNKELLLAGQVSAVLADYYETEKIKDLENAKYYVIALISSGEILEVKDLLNSLTEEYPNETGFREDLKQIYIFEQNFVKAEKLGLNEIEKTQLELKKSFFEDVTELDNEVYQKILKINNRTPYFPSRLEYLYLFIKFSDSRKKELIASKAKELEKKITELNSLIKTAREEIEKEAKDIIDKNQKILFPKSLDFYELAEAYRILALINLMESEDSSKFGKLENAALAESQGKLQKARVFLNMAQINYNRMRSIWLIEDTKFYKPIMKQYEKITEFGYVLPQWILALKRVSY